MESWQLERFKRPYLAIDSVGYDPTSNAIELSSRGCVYTIEPTEPACDLSAIATLLHSLRDVQSDLWTTARHPESEYSGLLKRMDELALIEESTSQDSEEKVLLLLDLVNQLPDIIVADLAEREKTTLLEFAGELEELCGPLVSELIDPQTYSNGASRSRYSPTNYAFDCTMPFYALVSYIQIHYQRRFASVSLILSEMLLRALTRRSHKSALNIPDSQLGQLLREFAVTGNLKDALTHLNCLADLLLRVGRQEDQQVELPGAVVLHGCSGVTLAVEAQKSAEAVLSRLGSSRFLEAIAQSPLQRSLAEGCFIEEYHVTCRFVEIIAATLTQRLKEPLRKLLFQYYAEEIGHEKFELTTCKSLGIDEDTLQSAIPLPLHFAFVDLFTYISASDPISYFASIFVTEGMYGSPSPLNDYIERGCAANPKFRQVFRRHERLNTELYHSDLSRLLMAEIPYVSPTQARRAIETVMLLTTLNFHAWDALYLHYSSPDPIPYQGVFKTVSRSLQELFG